MCCGGVRSSDCGSLRSRRRRSNASWPRRTRQRGHERRGYERGWLRRRRCFRENRENALAWRRHQHTHAWTIDGDYGGEFGNCETGLRERGFAPWAERNLQPLLRIEAVSKRFGEFTAVDQLSLDVFQGEFFALLGPSGCGKTTLLRLIAGFRSRAPAAFFSTVSISGRAAASPPVNMMFRSYALFPHLTVEADLAFGLKQEGLPKSEIASRVADMLALVKLENFGRRKPHELSGGQRQRVALSRSLVKRPRVLFLDEPMAALDKKLRGETQFELMDLQRRLGLTFVIVTHDQSEAMTVADRIAVMDRGRLMQVAPPAEIYEQPNSRWVADFIGTIDLFEGRVGDAAGTIEGTALGRLRIAGKIDASPTRRCGSRCGRRRSASSVRSRADATRQCGELRARSRGRYRLSRRLVAL